MTDLTKTLTDIATRKVGQNNLQMAFDEIAIGLLRQTKIVTPKDHFHLTHIAVSPTEIEQWQEFHFFSVAVCVLQI